MSSARFVLLTTVMTLLLATPAWGAGLAFNENFSVLTPTKSTREEAQALADNLLAQAEHFRKTLAIEWLGEELSSGQGRTMISVAITDENAALTWPVDHPDRTTHMVYLSTSANQALGSALKHEMVHVIMATRFGQTGGLPAWLEEGIASRYDDPRRISRRRAIIGQFSQTRQWPQLANIVTRKKIAMSDTVSYAVSSSVVDFLLTRGDKQQLVKFGAAISRGETENALRQYYGFPSLGALQTAWQAWVQRSRTL